MNFEEFKYLIVSNLSDDLLDKKFRKIKQRSEYLPSTFGHCYVASEVAYHLLGGKETGWKAYYVKHLGCPHWFLKHETGYVLDMTASQFKVLVPYDKARGIGFLTKEPSKRAKVLIKKISTSPTWKLLKL